MLPVVTRSHGKAVWGTGVVVGGCSASYQEIGKDFAEGGAKGQYIAPALGGQPHLQAGPKADEAGPTSPHELHRPEEHYCHRGASLCCGHKSIPPGIDE